MNHWNLSEVDVEARSPHILSTNDEGRAILINLPAGEELQEHEVHERAWLTIVAGEVRVEDSTGQVTTGSAGHLFEWAPQERHTVEATSDARMLLLLTPWPGDGHPGAMTLEEKATARERAADRERG